MHKVERRMVKTNAMNTQGDKIQAIVHKAYIKKNRKHKKTLSDLQHKYFYTMEGPLVDTRAY